MIQERFINLSLIVTIQKGVRIGFMLMVMCSISEQRSDVFQSKITN
jgi:hypothetical protein